MTMNAWQFASAMAGLVPHVDAATGHGLEAAARVVKTEAKRVLGTYDYGWPALSPVTVANKGGRDTPGIDTRELRGSIDYTMVGNNEVCIGTDLAKGEWFELGTSRQPPRSFLVGAAQHKGPEIVDAFQDAFFRHLFI